jgi:ABC-type glycerol-3-phosphate transport system permease component
MRFVYASAKQAISLIVLIIFAFPFAWMASSAFKPRVEIFQNVFPFTWKTLIPQNPTLINFAQLLGEKNFGTAMLNSTLVAIATVILSLVLCSMFAYILTFLQFPGRGFIFVLVLSTSLVPFEARMVPSFLVVQNFGLSDSYLGVIVPWIVDTFIVFFLRQQMAGIPKEIVEAAIVDGCSFIRIYWNMILPNIKPALISAAMIQFISAWDAYLWPLIILRDPTKTLVAIELAKLFTDQQVYWEFVFAGSVLATLPAILIFILLQRYYVAGMTSSGING